MDNQIIFSDPLVTLKDVMRMTKRSRSTIYAMGDKKSRYYDPSFPVRIKIGQRSVAWLKHEILKWLNDKSNNR